MAKEQSIGIVLTGGRLEWAAVSASAKGSGFEVASGCVALAAVQAPAEGEQAPAVGARLAGAAIPVSGSAAVGVPSAVLLLRVVRLPKAEGAELAGMVELQADKFSPFAAEAQACSHEVLQRGDNDQLVLIAAVRQDVVNTLRDELAVAGLKPVRIDAAVMGYWRLLRDKMPTAAGGGRRTIVVLDRPVAELVVVDDGIPVAFRTIELDAGAPDDVWVRELAGETDYTLLSVEMEFGPRPAAGVDLWYAGDGGEALAEGLHGAIGCEVHARPLAELGTAAEGVAMRLADSAGAGMDLTPAAWRQTDAAARFKRRVWGGAAAAVAAWAVLAGVLVGAMAYQRGAVRRLGAERERWGQEASAVRGMRTRVFAIEGYTNQAHSALECLREISERQTPGVEMTAFDYRKGENIKVSGVAGTVNQVYDFKSQIDASELFLDSELQGPRWDERRRQQVFDVTIRLPEDG